MNLYYLHLIIACIVCIAYEQNMQMYTRKTNEQSKQTMRIIFRNYNELHYN